MSDVLVTGGTGSFGTAYVHHLLTTDVERVVVYSRDEYKQWQMQRALTDDRLRFFIGDVRDPARLKRAMQGIDTVVHAAALKHVPVCEYNPFEAIKTNIDGTQNVIEAAIDAGVRRVVALSSDKAAAPANLYGATKLAAEKLVTAAGNYTGDQDIRFAAVRYGNVLCSRGSVVPLFEEQAKTGTVTITDARMTRFTMTPAEAVALVGRALTRMEGGEVFVAKCPSYRITDVAAAVAPDAAITYTGMRPGEHLHEVMVTEDETCVDVGDGYIILTDSTNAYAYAQRHAGYVCHDMRYASDDNSVWLTVEEIRDAVESTRTSER